jgi:hypothetical protein
VGEPRYVITMTTHVPCCASVGLGSLLLRELGQAALDRGSHRFTALMRAENMPAQNVLRASGLPFSLEINSATSEIVLWLDGQGPPPGGDDYDDDPAAHHATRAATPTTSIGRTRVGKVERPAPPFAGTSTKNYLHAPNERPIGAPCSCPARFPLAQFATRER